MAAEGSNFTSASLYVGDLKPEVTEALLFKLFNAVGPVASIRVCRDAVTRTSLGYAYVNFHNSMDAERALDTMNYTNIRNQPCRIMWSMRNPSLRKSNLGNIFVKNLDKTIDNKTLHDTFSMFGEILSCRVALDELGNSLGYGFVHYQTAEAAKKAIEKVNNMVIAKKQVYVAPFQPRKDRGVTKRVFTNVFLKNFPKKWKADDLKDLVKEFGEVDSCYIKDTGQVNGAEDESKDTTTEEEPAKTEEAEKADAEKDGEDKPKEEGKEEAADESNTTEDPKTNGVTPGRKKKKVFTTNWGFVNFKNAADAEKCVNELNGREINGEAIYVGRAETKAERMTNLKKHAKKERQAKFQGVNLYVKNLADSFDDEKLKELFSSFGNITSSRVMVDPTTGKSRGFGFVCFETSDMANRAMQDMNSKIVQSKPLYVGLAQRKEDRRSALEQQARRRAQRATNESGSFGSRGGSSNRGGFYGGNNMMMGRGMPGRGQPNAMRAPWFNNGMAGGFSGRGQPGQGTAPIGPYGATPMGGAMMHGRGRGGMPQGFGGGPRMPGAQPNVGGHPGVQQTPGGPQQQTPASHGFQSSQNSFQGKLDATVLASADAGQQKQMIGEKIFPLIQAVEPRLAGKITGMLLEMDNTELLHLIESRPALMGKINEALMVLKQYNTDQTSMPAE